MLATLEEGLKAVPGNVKLESMYGSYYLKKEWKLKKTIIWKLLLPIM